MGSGGMGFRVFWCRFLSEIYGISDYWYEWDCTYDDGHWTWDSTMTPSYSNNGLTFSTNRYGNQPHSTCDVTLPTNFEAEITYVSGNMYVIETLFAKAGITHANNENITWYYYRTNLSDSTQDYNTESISESLNNGDKFKVRRENGIITFYHNNTLKHTINEPSQDNGIYFVGFNDSRSTTVKDIKVTKL